MPKLNGIELARSIRQNDQKALIIFITSHEKYIYDAFDIRTFNYLVKPLKYEKFIHVLNKARDLLCQCKQIFCFQYKFTSYSIDFDNILYIEKFLHQNTLYTVDGNQHKFNMTLNDINQQLDDTSFVYVQRSIVVNLKYVQRIEGEFLFLKHKAEPIFISRRNRTNLKSKHLNYARRLI